MHSLLSSHAVAYINSVNQPFGQTAAGQYGYLSRLGRQRNERMTRKNLDTRVHIAKRIIYESVQPNDELLTCRTMSFEEIKFSLIARK